jgi:DNA polymerase type B, organellar and viral
MKPQDTRVTPISTVNRHCFYGAMICKQTGTDFTTFMYKNSTFNTKSLHESVDKSSYWSTLVSSLLCKHKLWLYGWDMYEKLCYLDIFNEFDSGRATIFKSGNSHLDDDDAKPMICDDFTLIAGNPPTIIEVIFPQSKRVVFIDLLNLGLKKEHFASGIANMNLDDVTQAIQDYIVMCKTFNMGRTKQTSASQGLESLRINGLDNIMHATVDDDARLIERQSYTAGRAEAFFLGQSTRRCYHLDVKSMYSSIVAECELPTSFHLKIDDGEKLKEFVMSDKCLVIADVVVKTEFPIVPVKLKETVIHPIGTFRTTLCTPEIRVVYDRATVESCYSFNVYNRMNPLRRFASWYFNTRDKLEENGLGHMEQCLKSIVNSTYGKLGYTGQSWINYKAFHGDQRWGQWIQKDPTRQRLTQWRAISGLVQYLSESKEPSNSLPYISSFICSYGRVKLLNYIDVAGHGNVLYVDTDGLIVNDIGYDRLNAAGSIRPNVPGFLSVREVGYDVEIFGIKHYRFNNRICLAGAHVSREEHDAGITRRVEHVPFVYSLFRGTPFVNDYIIAQRTQFEKYRHGHRSGNGRVTPLVMDYAKNDETGEFRNIVI